LVDENVENQLFRELEKPPYKLIVASDSFGMRGIDFRSNCNPIFKDFVVISKIIIIYNNKR
jgi:hypothetical protein